MEGRKILGYISSVLLLSLVAFVTGCSDEDIVEQSSVPGVPPEHVPVRLMLPEVYNGWVSRASVENPDLDTSMIHPLPNGSTIRVLVLNEAPAETGEVKATSVVTEMVYLIKQVNRELYRVPCQVDANGVMIPGSETDVPYYLPVANEAGKKYYCMAISPARELVRDNGLLKLSVRNHEELLVTNNDWIDTQYESFDVPTDVSKQVNIQLKPLHYATAKIRITVTNGDRVTELEPCHPYAELDRIPTNPGDKWISDKTDGTVTHLMPKYNLVFGRSIEEQMGNNILYNRTYIRTVERAPIWYTIDDDGKQKKVISMTGELNILPMDARPTPMIIRMDIDVNHTPMQFQYQTSKRFRPGHVYDFNLEISLDPNSIYVASWQDMEWSDELPYLPPKI